MDQFATDMLGQWPVKTREFQNFCIDSTIWNNFKFRDDDIIIATWAKSGTTWVQQMVAQFIFNSDTEGKPIADMSPWVDFRLPPPDVKMPQIEAQTHRRFLKTHLPVDALVFSPKVKYVYIARDGRDVVWSMYNHHKYMLPWVYEAFHALPVKYGPVLDPPQTDDLREYFLGWLREDGSPWWPFWENIRTWWAIKDLPNVHFLHYQNLKNDMAGEMARMGKFLGYDVDAIPKGTWDTMVYHCSFDYMKNNATDSTPLGGSMWEGGAAVFVNKGENKRWSQTLKPEDISAYEARALEELGPECAYWLATGIGA